MKFFDWDAIELSDQFPYMGEDHYFNSRFEISRNLPDSDEYAICGFLLRMTVEELAQCYAFLNWDEIRSDGISTLKKISADCMKYKGYKRSLSLIDTMLAAGEKNAEKIKKYVNWSEVACVGREIKIEFLEKYQSLIDWDTYIHCYLWDCDYYMIKKEDERERLSVIVSKFAKYIPWYLVLDYDNYYAGILKQHFSVVDFKMSVSVRYSSMRVMQKYIDRDHANKYFEKIKESLAIPSEIVDQIGSYI